MIASLRVILPASRASTVSAIEEEISGVLCAVGASCEVTDGTAGTSSVGLVVGEDAPAAVGGCFLDRPKKFSRRLIKE